MNLASKILEGIAWTVFLGLTAAIIIPNFVRAKAGGRPPCSAYLKQIAGAKEQWALERRRKPGDRCTLYFLVPEYIRNNPECPDGGVYTVGPVGSPPTCSLGARDKEHRLPAP